MMDDEDSSKSNSSDTDDLDSCMWSLKNRKNLRHKISECRELPIEKVADNNLHPPSFENSFKKFEELKVKSSVIKKRSAKKSFYAEKRRARQLVKQALKDPFIKELVEQKNSTNNNDKETEANEWKNVKPFLNVNSHIQGSVSHGDWGPKTEIECTIDKAIKEGDFEKAELLSDTLANKEFAAKIAKAYSAKRSFEESEKQKLLIKEKNSKKIRWTFDAKERWQMKGNM